MDNNAIEVTFGGITLRHRSGDDDGSRIWSATKGIWTFQIYLFLRGTGPNGEDYSGKWAVNVYDTSDGGFRRAEGMTLLDSPDAVAETMFSKYRDY